MDEYHRGFEDAVELVSDSMTRRIVERNDVEGFIAWVGALDRRVHEHKTVQLGEKMGL